MAASPIDAVLIHAVYLLNCASEDRRHPREIAGVSDPLAARRAARSARAAWCCTPARPRRASSARRSRGRARRSARRSPTSEGCELHLENTAGAGGTLGRSFDELARLLEAAGAADGAWACAWTPATCSPPAMTSARATAWRASLREAPRSSAAGGCARCTSTTRRRRSAPTATATPTSAAASSARRAAWRSCRRPACSACRACSRPPGEQREGPSREEVAYANELHERGVAARRTAVSAGARQRRGARGRERARGLPGDAGGRGERPRASARRASPTAQRVLELGRTAGVCCTR